MRCLPARYAAVLLLVLGLGAGALAGCGRGSMVGRRVGDFSAYYNTFYNARNAFAEGTRVLDERDQPIDQNAYLPVFVEPTQVGGEEAFEKTIEKSADLLREHPRSKWVDDALLLIGKAYFYQENYVGAERKFREVIERDGPLLGEARFWLGRALLSSGDHVAAEQHLNESLRAAERSERWAAHMQLLLGDLYVRRGLWPDAAEALAEGLPGLRDGRIRARAFFLRGQALEAATQYAEAARAYRSAAGERPRYELAYAAETSALRMAARAGEGAEVLRQLRRLERDDKNEAKRGELALLRAQIYQAQDQPARAKERYLALLYPGEDRSTPALSAAVRGRAHYELATLYRDMYRDFTQAAVHFDTSATALAAPARAGGEEGRAAPRAPYAITDSRRQAERYAQVAEAAGALARADSLLRLGAMDDDAFRAFVDSLQRARAASARSAEQAQARRREAQRFQRGGGVAQQRGAARQTLAAAGEAGFLYHRDPVQVQQGRRSFVQRWGQRPRVSNWRRRAAISTQADAEVPGNPAQTVGPDEDLAATGLPRVDISAVPRGAQRLRNARAERAALQYDLGNALLLAAEQPDSAAAWFRRVVAEGADTAAVQRARYALAEAERAAGRTEEAREQYRQVARTQAGTQLARRAEQRLSGRQSAARAPDASPQAEAAYARAYRRWQEGAREAALQQMLDAAADYPASTVAPRALLASARIFTEWSRRTRHALTAPLPVRLPEALPAVLEDSSLSAAPRLALPDSTLSDSTLSDSTLQGTARPDSAFQDSTVQDSTLRAVPQHSLTLERLLAGLVRGYPQTAHARRARGMLQALRERYPQRLGEPPAGRVVPSRADSSGVPADSAAGAADASEQRRVVAQRLPGEAPPSDSTATEGQESAGGQALAGGTGPWTIVVVSVREQSRAEAVAARFRERFGTVRVIAPASRAEQRYRVGVGRFATQAEAEAALRRHPSALPSDSWVLQASPPSR